MLTYSETIEIDVFDDIRHSSVAFVVYSKLDFERGLNEVHIK